jgi:ribonuclease HII
VKTLAEVRSAVSGEQDPRRLRSWCKRLEADPRAGAQALRAQIEKRLQSARAERQRVRKLFALRGRLQDEGARFVAGVDEVGMGPLAGPVVAAAVVLGADTHLPGLDDSKRVPRAAREDLDRELRDRALAIGIGVVSPEEIDRMNIYQAGLEAMRRAVASMPIEPDHLLVDARRVPGVVTPQTALVHGDAIDGSIAAASIVAKVHRDAMMREFDARHAGYDFASHKGYATSAHLAALRQLGPSPIHRRSFAPVAAAHR